MGLVWDGDPIPRPRPVIPAPVPFIQSLPHRVPAPPQYDFFFFFFHSFWLNYMKQKNSISVTTINLLANKFAINQFTSINLHKTTIHA
jgi:hypothetical protein